MTKVQRSTIKEGEFVYMINFKETLTKLKVAVPVSFSRTYESRLRTAARRLNCDKEEQCTYTISVDANDEDLINVIREVKPDYV